ncbi:alanine racemase [Amycolatopsis pithecellobii]|uniref:alanine racemase n=1 Tax=Amycolatopsis pithecellobii TaxID=664692 RepID=UPI001407239C|nr:alanine racemase [Amycolatopsis pithecellobii]
MLRIPEVTIGVEHKGFPISATGRPTRALSGTLDDFLTPVLVLKRTEFEHNLELMTQFCEEHGISLSPHVKTTMSPEIADAQLAHGAWAITLATPSQVRTFRELGAQRVILANELVDPQAIAWLSTEMDADPEFTCYCYVESLDGVDILEKELAQRESRRALPVILELGVRGGRAGVRESPRLLAERVAVSGKLRLAGVGGFEGVISGALDAPLLADVRAFLRRLRDTADELRGMVDTEFVVTVGGSSFPELVAAELGNSWQRDGSVRVVLRSGCYVVHDSLGYQRFRELVATEYDTLPFQPSLELWGRVLSTPEPRLAILDFGKRDTGVDAGLPVPLHRIRRASAVIEPAPPGELTALNDQHAYFRGDLDVGDRVGFGISHPCTTFDKWRLFPVMDDSYVLCGTVQTLF